MNLTKKMQGQGGKPSGLFGKIIGNMMNVFHRDIHRWGLQKVPIQSNSICLDIGCGGGNVIKLMAKDIKNGKVYGLDHSKEMVDLSMKLNRNKVTNRLVEVQQGSVSALPYSDSFFDIITAFETIQFWPDPRQNIKEVKRVLKSTGTLIIANRYPIENSKWSSFLKIKNSKEYNDILISAGFSRIEIDTKKKGWILIFIRY